MATNLDDVERQVQQRTMALVKENQALKAEIEERKRTEETLRDAQSILINAQSVAQVGSWEVDGQTGTMRCSDEYFRICGLEPQSMQPNLLFTLNIVHPDDRDDYKKAIKATKQDLKEFKSEKRVLRPDGAIRYVMSRGQPVVDEAGKLVRVVGSFLDITEHKRTEQALRESQASLRELAAHLERAKEEERKRIAREIHDGLGGLLTGINANMAVLIDRAERAGVPPEREVVAASELANFAIDSVRRVIADLRPSVLDQLGVWDALDWYAGQFAERTGLACTCAVDAAAAATELCPERSTALFRTVQEALTNVVRHAGASRVAVRARLDGAAVVVEIEDDGKGIQTEQLLGSDSWGVVGMRERARYFGGELKISGFHSQGTLVILHMPLEGTNA